MNRGQAVSVCVVAGILGGPGRPAADAKPRPAPQLVILDGTAERVVWSDGDSFRIVRGKRKGTRVRVSGYNTLESYGPVHFWGGFDGDQLHEIARAAARFVRARRWKCTSLGERDGHDRILVDCRGLGRELLARGYAHVFRVGEQRIAGFHAAQDKAQAERLGLWKLGIPAFIVTSVHSADDADSASHYNRVIDTRTGHSTFIVHGLAFKSCDVWCYGGSCMIHVPHNRRYGRTRPSCLSAGGNHRLVAPYHLGTPTLKD